jgi:hypothetical protein
VRAREEAARVRAELDALMLQLREANEHLVVANLRSQALAEEADKANHLKDEFIAMVSHELRTPLNAVLGWARMLASKQLTTDVPRMPSRPSNATPLPWRSSSTTSSMWRASSPGPEADVPARRRGAVTEAAVDVVRPLAAAKHIDLTYAADPSLTEVVNGDPVGFSS